MLNNWTGEGRITDNLQLSKTTDGVSVLRFSIAIDKRNAKKLKEQNKPSTNFIRCLAWRETAEMIAQYFSKGSPIGITGSIETSNYTDRNGNNRSVTEIAVNNVHFPLQNSKQEPQPTQQSYSQQSSTANAFSTVDDLIDPDNDLPF